MRGIGGSSSTSKSCVCTRVSDNHPVRGRGSKGQERLTTSPMSTTFSPRTRKTPRGMSANVAVGGWKILSYDSDRTRLAEGRPGIRNKHTCEVSLREKGEG